MKVKLRDLTNGQYYKWRNKNCDISMKCTKCPFSNVICDRSKISWINNKDLYSDKFLNQEIEIVEPILDEQEKKYLENLTKPFKNRVTCITKCSYLYNHIFCFINIFIDGIDETYCKKEVITLPYFRNDTMYKNMELYKQYTIKELGLFEND